MPLNISAPGILSAMKRLKISYKKTLNYPKACEKKEKPLCKRSQNIRSWGCRLDESGFSQSMPRTHGYAKIGERCFGTHDWGAKGLLFFSKPKSNASSVLRIIQH